MFKNPGINFLHFLIVRSDSVELSGSQIEKWFKKPRQLFFKPNL